MRGAVRSSALWPICLSCLTAANWLGGCCPGCLQGCSRGALWSLGWRRSGPVSGESSLSAAPVASGTRFCSAVVPVGLVLGHGVLATLVDDEHALFPVVLGRIRHDDHRGAGDGLAARQAGRPDAVLSCCRDCAVWWLRTCPSSCAGAMERPSGGSGAEFAPRPAHGLGRYGRSSCHTVHGCRWWPRAGTRCSGSLTNPPLADFLPANGKKLALTACMCRLLTILNSMVGNVQRWDPTLATS